MRKTALVVNLCALGMALPAAAADAPSGWQTHEARDGKCQISAPADWKQTAIGKGSVGSPDGKTDAWVDGSELSYAMFKQAVLPSLKPAKVIKNTDSYYAAELKSGNPANRTLYVIMARGKDATCRVELHYNPKTEDLARKIGDSLRLK